MYLIIYYQFQHIVDHVRATSYSSAYAATMAPSVMQQVISSMKIIMGEDGTNEGTYYSMDSYDNLQGTDFPGN